MDNTLFKLWVFLTLSSRCLWIVKSQATQANIDYAKLKLDTKALLGSRWAIERLAKNLTIIVYHAFEIVDIVKVDLENMNIRVDYHIRQRWLADSLELPDGLFKPNEDAFVITEQNVLNSVWSPDSFIPNARETKIHSVAVPQSVVTIFSNKTIIYKARMHTLLGCSFSFEWYPLDMQTCDLVFESYKHSTKIVLYEWEDLHPVVTDSSIRLYQYDLVLPPMITTGYHKRWAGITQYPYVKVTFKFERKLGNNIIQIFVPTILVVILSWFSFWLGLDAVPGRISLLVTCILTLVTMHSSLKGVIPAVHYIKMMDIWMVGCMAFVFAAMCEFVLAKYTQWRSIQREKVKEDQEKYLQKNNYHNMMPPPPALMPNGTPGYPQEYSQHPYIQSYKNSHEGGNKPPLSTSAQQRQAWERAYALGAIGAPPDFLLQRHGPPGDYPGAIRMPEMAMYNQHMIPPPPPPVRPVWVNIDRVCRIVFPILFISFNAVYWPILLIGSSKQHPDYSQ